MKIGLMIVIALALFSFVAWFQYKSLTCDACKRRKCEWFGIGCNEYNKIDIKNLADQADSNSNSKVYISALPSCCQ